MIGCLTVCNLFGDARALSDTTLKALPQGFWSSFGYLSHDGMAALPNSFIAVSLASLSITNYPLEFGSLPVFGMLG